MYFPWIGFLEQIKLCNKYIVYDTADYSKGSFTNRVQFKTTSGLKWLTIPIQKKPLGTSIDEIVVDDTKKFREKHITQLTNAYRTAPYLNDMIQIVERVLSISSSLLSDISLASTIELAKYFDIWEGKSLLYAKDMNCNSINNSQKVLDLVLQSGGSHYITGHGALKYLDNELFKKSKIDVLYMVYSKLPYPQLHGTFTPYVSALDLVANCGKNGRNLICPSVCSYEQMIS